MAWYSIPATVAPVLPLAQLENATDTTPGDVSGQTLAQAIADQVSGVPYTPAVANGQTVFTLPSVPLNAASVEFRVDGVPYYAPDITVGGTTVTWAGPFALAAADTVRIHYI